MEHGYHNFDFQMLAGRIAEITESLRRKAPFDDLPVGYFGTSTDAAAMAIAAAQPDSPAGALVMCDARPELASVELPRIHAPTLFIVEDDELALDLNRSALAKLGCRGDLAILRGMDKGLASPGDSIGRCPAGRGLVRDPPPRQPGRLILRGCLPSRDSPQGGLMVGHRA